jgi:hypothetical protein
MTMSTKQNCWESKKCEREPGGAKEAELGVCPAAEDTTSDGLNGGKNGGRICWAVAGTLCGGETQGAFAEKEQVCADCDFLKKVQEEEGAGFLPLRPGQISLRSQPEGSGRFHIREGDLYDLGPEKARDLIIKCFYRAQKEALAETAEALHLGYGDLEIYDNIVHTVELAFKEAGVDFAGPTKRGLERVVGVLAEKAYSWNTPVDVIEHNVEVIQKILDRLEG